MKVLGVFNHIGPGNIGLENLIKQTKYENPEVLVTSQDQSEALRFLETAYPEYSDKISVNGPSASRSCICIFLKIIGRPQQIVHAHHTSSAFLCALARLMGRFKFIVTAHANFRSYRVHQKAAFFIAYLMSDKVVCNSQATRISLPSLINKSRISVIYNGVDFDRLDNVLQLNEPTDEKPFRIVGTLARMVPQKDLKTLIRAFCIAHERAKIDITLRIVGDGPEKEELESLVAQLGMEDYIDFTGSVPRDAAYRYLSDMDIFVVSSRWEGFCNAMVEAGAAGKAIIASNVEPLPEVIGNDNALFFEVGDHKALAARITDLVEDPERRSNLAKKAYRFTRDRYSLEESAARYRKVYEGMMQGRESARL